jgi:hypothetical protein
LDVLPSVLCRNYANGGFHAMCACFVLEKGHASAQYRQFESTCPICRTSVTGSNPVAEDLNVCHRIKSCGKRVFEPIESWI